MTETFDASLISAITHVIAQACTLGFSLIRQSSAVPIVCFRAIDQASSDAFNGQNRTISFDRVPFTLAYRTSPDFAFNLSAAGLHIKMIDRTYPIPYAGTVARKHCAIYEEELQRIWPLSEENRKAKIEQFAREYGFQLSFYKLGLCAIFEKDSPRKRQ
jgi:hypothetical protein